jgi:OCT family organic cation transporter-like MFS transporter 4/5
VDFEGILKIIGGFSAWQFRVYLLLAFQQIPHAMLSLGVIFMMIAPAHWCYIREMDPSFHTHAKPWTAEEIRNISVPHYNPEERTYCTYYKRDYHSLAHVSFDEAIGGLPSLANSSILKCSNWSFDRTEMHHTIVTQWNLVCDKKMYRGHAHLVYSCGYLVGCFLSGICSDKFGRKPTIIFFGAMGSLLGIMLAYANYFELFLLIRFLGAICNEAADLAAYVLCMEITGVEYRTVTGSLQQIPWALGYTLLALVAYLTRDWRTIQLIAAGIHACSIICVCFVPESPRWLMATGRLKEAEATIRRAACKGRSLPPNLELAKPQELKKRGRKRRLSGKGNAKEEDKPAGFWNICESVVLVQLTLILFGLWLVAALIYYGISLNLSDQSMEGRRTFSGNLFLNNAIAGAIEIPVLLSCTLLRFVGRKVSLMTCLMGAAFMMFAACMTPQEEALRPLRLVFMLFGKAAAQGSFIILYIYTTELYPTITRNTFIGVASMVARVGAAVAGYLAILSDANFPMVPLIIFAAFAFSAGTVAIFLPETRNQPLPETFNDTLSIIRKDTGCGYGSHRDILQQNIDTMIGNALEEEKAKSYGGNASHVLGLHGSTSSSSSGLGVDVAPLPEREEIRRQGNPADVTTHESRGG